VLREGRGAGRAEAQTDGQQAQRVAEGRGEGCAASGRRMEEQRKGSEPNQRARLCDRLHAKKCRGKKRTCQSLSQRGDDRACKQHDEMANSRGCCFAGQVRKLRRELDRRTRRNEESAEKRQKSSRMSL